MLGKVYLMGQGVEYDKEVGNYWLRQEYSRFSKAAGLRTENERAQVAGFGWGEAARATAEYKRVEKLADSMYDIGSTEKNVAAWLRDQPLRNKILAGKEYPSVIESGQQRKHIQGTLEYAQSLVDKYRGTGILPRAKDGRWLKTEIITVHPDIIGVAVNNRTGAEADTMVFKIHYGKKGTHIVPDYPSKKGAKARE